MHELITIVCLFLLLVGKRGLFGIGMMLSLLFGRDMGERSEWVDSGAKILPVERSRDTIFRRDNQLIRR